VAAVPLGAGLWSDLAAVWRADQAETPYLAALPAIARTVSFRTLAGIRRIA
jgi:hypothetical protein